jgi:hypothetical protein
LVNGSVNRGVPTVYFKSERQKKSFWGIKGWMDFSWPVGDADLLRRKPGIMG